MRPMSNRKACAAPAVRWLTVLFAALGSLMAEAADAAQPGASPDSLVVAAQDPLEQDLLLLPEPYYYDALGRRDIFVPLISDGGDGESDENVEPDMGSLQVLGILWGENDRYALVESEEGKSLILREGDSFGEAMVAEIHPDRVVLHVTRYGGMRVKTLKLVQGGVSNETGDRNRR